MAEQIHKFQLDTFPDFVKYIDNEDMAKWLIIVLKYGFYCGYDNAEDLITMVEIEFNKLTDIDEEQEYINMIYQDSELTGRLADIVMSSEVAHIDEETGEEYAESFYLPHFCNLIEESFDEMKEFFDEFEKEGYKNAMFPTNQGRNKILWMGVVDEK